MEIIVAIFMSSACMIVAFRRLLGVLQFPAVDLRTLLAAMKDRKSDVVALLAEAEEGSWERLCAEGHRLTGDAAHAILNEALLELQFGLSKGARVPRITASVASSMGFLLASLVLRRGLVSAEDAPVPVFDGLIIVALNVVAVGIAGAVTCAAAGRIATGIAKTRWKDGEALVDALRPPSKDPESRTDSPESEPHSEGDAAPTVA